MKGYNSYGLNTDKICHVPEAIVMVTCDDIFGELSKGFSIESLMSNLPMIVVLHHILKRQLSVHFSMYANEPQETLLDELCNDLHKFERTHLYRFRRKHKGRTILYNTESSIRMCFEALVHGYELEYDDNQLDATRDEAIEINKAYTLCNSELVANQFVQDDLSETLLMLDLKASEFKFYKDPKAALFKACQFFNFCENNPVYQVYLDCFYTDCKINDWRNYLGRLLVLFQNSINNHAIKIDSTDFGSISFLQQFVINREDLKAIENWKNPQALLYFRNHFLIRFNGGIYFVISPDFIVDKMYQGLKFMFFDAIVKHGIKMSNGNYFEKLPQFTEQLGRDFSETSLAYTLFKKALSNNVDCLITGKEFNESKFPHGEPDLYIRKGNSLILVEVKDLLFPEAVKQSEKVEDVVSHIKSRICAYPEKPHKGFGQILDNIERLSKGIFNPYDSKAQEVKVVYPVIMTTDNAYSALGVNSEIVKQANRIMKVIGDKMGNRFISIPIILDIDTLISMSYRLFIGELDIFQVFHEYIMKCRAGLIPFKAYAYECFQRGLKFSKEENLFLFGEIISDN